MKSKIIISLVVGYLVGKGFLIPSWSNLDTKEGKILLIAFGVCLVVAVFSWIAIQMENDRIRG